MNNLYVNRSNLQGTITAPPSKSQTLRAILFASMANGDSVISNPLQSPDSVAMIKFCRSLGANIEEKKFDHALHITGVAGQPQTPKNIIDVGNSGQVLRFGIAISALLPNYVIFTGDHSIRYNRPIKPLLDGLQALGVFCVTLKNDEYAPVIIKGPMRAGNTCLSGTFAQPVSGMLMAAAFTEGETNIQVINPNETPWIDVTLGWFDRLQIPYLQQNYQHYQICGKVSYSGFTYHVPSDFSSIAFPVIAALLTKSEIIIEQVDWNDVQGDKQVIQILIEMGANIEIDQQHRRLIVKKTEKLYGKRIDINNFIDAITILAVVGCFAEGSTELYNAESARNKECDRLAAISAELGKMGAALTVTQDSLIIQNSLLRGTSVESYNDHRIAMSLAIAALAIEGETQINNTACIGKSYQQFTQDLQQLGANIVKGDPKPHGK